MSKHELNGDDLDAKNAAQETLNCVLTGILKLLHPYMPFITEELYSYLPGHEGMLINASWPTVSKEYCFPEDSARMEAVMEVIRSTRNLRAEMKVNASKKATLILKCNAGMEDTFRKSEGYLNRLASASSVEYLSPNEANPEKSASAVTPNATLFIPMGELVDIDKEILRLNKELEGTLGEIKRSEGKLNNPGFVAKAPANLIQQEKDKVEKNTVLAETIRERIKELESLR